MYSIMLLCGLHNMCFHSYNNQWMIVDYNKFNIGKNISNGTLWIIEQIPWDDKSLLCDWILSVNKFHQPVEVTLQLLTRLTSWGRTHIGLATIFRESVWLILVDVCLWWHCLQTTPRTCFWCGGRARIDFKFFSGAVEIACNLRGFGAIARAIFLWYSSCLS